MIRKSLQATPEAPFSVALLDLARLSQNPFVAVIGGTVRGARGRRGERIGGSPQRPRTQTDGGYSAVCLCRADERESNDEFRRGPALVQLSLVFFVKGVPVYTMSVSLPSSPRRGRQQPKLDRLQRWLPTRGSETGGGSSLDIMLKGDRWGLRASLKPASRLYHTGGWSTIARHAA